MKHFLLAFFCLLGIGTASAQETLNVNGSQRNMIVYAPKNLPENRPLVITLHGANQDANYQRNNTQWNNVADTAKIVVVYPDAIGKFWDTGCVRGQGDMLFITTIIDEMAKRYKINRNRVYISGFSLGTMMTYNCMEQISDLVAACAPVSGVRFDNRAPKASRQVPFIHTHGTGDDVFKWVGDPGHMAGGYPYIPDYVQKWATYYKCTDKEFVQPYPANKSGSKDAKTYWRKPGTDFEIQLLQLDGVGHWHSDAQGWGGISTTQEIWRFMSRYTLGPEPPTVKKVEPENLSFDLTSEKDRTFTLTLSGAADVTKAKATLKSATKTIKLEVVEKENGKTLTFAVPEGTVVPDNEYTFSATNIYSPGGAFSTSTEASYIYGITEVDDVLKIDTLLSPNWPSMQEELGQGIPWGWRVFNYDANDKTTSLAQGTANLESGCRLLYFPAGGNFTAGFYLSAESNAKALLCYGRYTSDRLNLPKGKYDLSFRSCFWNTTSKNNATTFDACLHVVGKTNNVFEVTGITPKGNQTESVTKKPTSTAQHKYALNITTKANYSLDFTIAKGKNAIVLADVMITSQVSVPEQYKGTFHRLMLECKSILASSDDPVLAPLRQAVDKYRDFAATSPSAYTTAIKALQTAMKCVPTGIATPRASAATNDVRYYSLDGRQLAAPQRGIVIERRGNNVRKLIIN